jgi:hypothetical protein
MLTACGGGGTEQNVTNLELTSTTTSLTTGTGYAVLTATVKDKDGKALPAATIQFTTTLGNLNASAISTDINGIAKATFYPGSTKGSAIITASVNGYSKTQTITVNAGIPSSSTSTISVSPTTVSPSGSSSVAIVLKDAYGNGVADNLEVGFASNISGATLSTDTGTSSTSVSTTTDSFGNAPRITYTAGSTAGTDTLQLRANASSYTQNTSVTVSSTSGVSIKSLAISAGNASITANVTSNTYIDLIVLDTNDKAVQGVQVNIASNMGTLSTSSTTKGSGITQTPATDSTGKTRIYLWSANATGVAKTGVAVVDASIGGINASTTVNLIPGTADAAKSSITATPNSLPADGASISTIKVVLKDSNDNLVPDGTVVSLSTTTGTISSTNPTVTSLGVATFTLQAPNAASTATLSVPQVSGLTGSVTFGSTATTGAPANITITPGTNQLFVRGVGKTESTSISITVKDSAGNLISNPNIGVNNIVVRFKTKPNGGETLTGTNASGTTVSNNSSIDVATISGSASVTLQSGTLPGIIELEVEAKDATGTSLPSPVIAALPQVSVSSGPPHTLVMSYSYLNSIINLNNGFYKRKGGIIVTDQYGNAVPDGSVINLGAIDSVISSNTNPAFGTSIADKDGSTTANADALTDAGGNGTFSSASITRNATSRSVQINDRILLLNAQANDKSRFVTSILGDSSLKTQKAYNNTGSNLEYLIGSSLSGISISGTNPQNSDSEQTGLATTKDGLATIYVTYPANQETINMGCFGNYPNNMSSHLIDTRFSPAGSAQTWVIAEASENGATSLDDRFCFAGINPWSWVAYSNLSFAKSSNPFTAGVNLELRDGGAGIPIPLQAVNATVSYTTNLGGLSISVANCNSSAPNTNTSDDGRTDTSGRCVTTFTATGGIAGDAATIYFSAGDTQPIGVSVTVP